jgi:hypothetical protein
MGKKTFICIWNKVVLVEAHPVKFVVIADVMLNPPAGLPNKYPEE